MGVILLISGGVFWLGKRWIDGQLAEDERKLQGLEEATQNAQVILDADKAHAEQAAARAAASANAR